MCQFFVFNSKSTFFNNFFNKFTINMINFYSNTRKIIGRTKTHKDFNSLRYFVIGVYIKSNKAKRFLLIKNVCEKLFCVW